MNALSTSSSFAKLAFKPSLTHPLSTHNHRGRALRSLASVPRCDFSPGARVRVAKSVMVYHVAKFKQGLDLQGLEGTVQEDTRQYKGMQLSSNLPWKVQLETEGPDGKALKIIAHLVRRIRNDNRHSVFGGVILKN